MADPLPTMTSAADFVSLGIQVVGALIVFYRAYEKQDENVSRTTKKLAGVLANFEVLQASLAEQDILNKEKRVLGTIQDCIREGEKHIKELKRQLNKFNKTDGDKLSASVRTGAQRLAYPFKKSTLAKIEADIEAMASVISLSLQVLQHRRTCEIQDDIWEMKTNLSLLQISNAAAGVHYWLAAPDTTAQYYDICSRKYPGAGLWFIQGDQFSAWLTTSNSFLYINGFAGCGKSFLCSSAIQHCFRYGRSRANTATAFFFFNFGDPSRQDAYAMLRALALQLSRQDEDANSLISQLCRAYKDSPPPQQVLLG